MKKLFSFILIVFLFLTITGCRIPSLGEILTTPDSYEVIDCSPDPRKEHRFSIVTLMDKKEYQYGDIFWVAVLIKHSSRLDVEDSSKKIRLEVSHNIETLEAIDSSLLPYTPEREDQIYFASHLDSDYHIPLDSEYRALIRFRYLADDNDQAEINFSYLQKVPKFSFGDNQSIKIRDHKIDLKHRDRLVDPFPAEECHPDYWNTIEDDGTDVQPFDLDGSFPPEICEAFLNADTYEESLEIKRKYLESLDE